MRNAPLLNLVLSLGLAVLIGWLLVVGQDLLLPIFTAIISVYVLITAADALSDLPVLNKLPSAVLKLLILVGFTLILAGLGLVVAVTVADLIALAPTYQANIDRLVTGIAETLGLEAQEVWTDLRAVTIDAVDLQALLVQVLGGFTSLGATVFLIVVYAAFLMSERDGFARKLAIALPDRDQAETAARVIADINKKIGDYLAVKTLINIILGVMSYAILWVMGVDFALFWALVIALLNYIPYVGSLFGVVFPVVLSLAQFGSLTTTLILAAFLTAAQTYVGNVLEPRMIGRQLNLSPFIVLVALSLWTALWGLPGAILAIPMTSMMAIVLASFDATRFLAVLLAERVGTIETDANTNTPEDDR
ncbi:MAG: AI-2E family transporter [Pseudomonadota bacterium]